MLLHHYKTDVVDKKMKKVNDDGNGETVVTMETSSEGASGGKGFPASFVDNMWGAHSTIVEIHGLIRSTSARGICRCLNLQDCFPEIEELEELKEYPDGGAMYSPVLADLIVYFTACDDEPNNRVCLTIHSSGYYSGRGPQIEMRNIIEKIVHILKKKNGCQYLISDSCVTHRF